VNASPRLLTFLMASLVVHGVVAIAWRVPVPAPRPGNTLRVSLVPPHRHQVRQTQAATRTNAGTRHQLAESPSAITAIRAHSGTAAHAATGSHRDRSNSVAARSVQARVAARSQGREVAKRIAHSLARFFHYPPVAIRYAWQGTVQIGLRVDRSGRISRIHLVHTSGYAVLDDAALRSTLRIKTVGRIAMPRSRSHYDLQLPVVYRLAES
jgi:TonB family protein